VASSADIDGDGTGRDQQGSWRLSWVTIAILSVVPEEPQEEPKPIQAIIVNKKWRWGAGLLGLGGLGAGGAAVYMTEVEAGPVALLLIGTIFAFVAMGGRLPTRVKVGENEAAWEAVQEYVKERIEEAAPEEKPEEIRRAAELASVAPQAAPVSTIAHELYAMTSIRRAVKSMPGVKVMPSSDHPDEPFDMEVRTTDNKRRLWIVVKSQLVPSMRQIEAMRARIDQIRGDDPILIVTNDSEGLPLPFINTRVFTVPHEKGRGLRGLRTTIELLLKFAAPEHEDLD
jgi:hypothetical protein